MRFLFVAFLFCSFSFNALANDVNVKVETPLEYTEWLESLKKEMIKRGISKNTIRRVYTRDYYKPDPEGVKLDRKQTEFVLTTSDYLNRVVREKRVDEARKRYKELYSSFKKLEEKYGVGFHYLIAFWGIETNFGETFGKFELIEALTTLAYDERRRKFFTEELYQALKIIDKYDIDHTKMESSWAGAMGHFQFMPSTFNAYAVDYDGDGKINVWSSFEDAVGSAANYLSEMGWKEGEEWGMEVTLLWNFEYENTGLGNVKTIKEWDKKGVRLLNGEKIGVESGTKASIIVPEGKKGQAYMVFDNFRKIMRWNRSENYALAVGILADYVKSGKKWKAFEKHASVQVKTEDVMKFQAFFNKFFNGKLDEDGTIGSKTKEAIKQVQKKAKMPQDGYLSYQLMQKISNYDPEIGFTVPVPVRKNQ